MIKICVTRKKLYIRKVIDRKRRRRTLWEKMRDREDTEIFKIVKKFTWSLSEGGARKWIVWS